jgi:hypothetical protein
MCRTAPTICMLITEAPCRVLKPSMVRGNDGQTHAQHRNASAEQHTAYTQYMGACAHQGQACMHALHHAQHAQESRLVCMLSTAAHAVQRTRDASSAQKRMPRTCAAQHTRGAFTVLERLCRRARMYACLAHERVCWRGLASHLSWWLQQQHVCQQTTM